MRCRHTRKLISRYVDEMLNADEKSAFESHINQCVSCAEALEETRTLQRLFASAPPFSAPYGFAARVIANLEGRGGRQGRSLDFIRPFILRAAQVALALVVMTVGIISGKSLITDDNGADVRMTVRQAFSIDLFQAVPPDSFGATYILLTGGSHEK